MLYMNAFIELSKAHSFYKWENWVPEKGSDLPTSWSWNQDYLIPSLVHILPLQPSQSYQLCPFTHQHLETFEK